MFDWALEIIDQCKPIAAAVDAAQGGTAYAQSLADARATLIAPQRLPSARVLEAMARDSDQSYTGLRASAVAGHPRGAAATTVR